MSLAKRSTRFAPRIALVAVVSVACGTMNSAVERNASQPARGMVGVVGNWAAVNDSGPAFRIDGAAWNGETPRAELEGAGRSLFGQTTEAFLANGTAPGAFPLAVWRDVSDFTSGSIRVRFKLVGGASDQTAGVVVGLQPTGEYMFVRYNTKDGNVAIWAYADGARRRIADGETKAQLPLNTWHELTVMVKGMKVSGSVDGTLVVEHTLDKPLSGRVGLWTKRDAITVFRDFRVDR
jgi:hypothetical protein